MPIYPPNKNSNILRISVFIHQSLHYTTSVFSLWCFYRFMTDVWRFSCFFTFTLTVISALSFPSVMNGHTACARLLLDESDSADLIDAADSQGQWVLVFFFFFCFRVLFHTCPLFWIIWFVIRSHTHTPFSSRTPLMLAVAGGHIDSVSLLLEREVNVNMASHNGLTALHLGVSFNFKCRMIETDWQYLSCYTQCFKWKE